MGKYKDLMAELTYTDGAADARTIRERTQSQVFGEGYEWRYRETLDDLFIIVRSNDHASSVNKGPGILLPVMNLPLSFSSEEYIRELAAKLLGRWLLHHTEATYSLDINLRTVPAEEADYMLAFAAELLLPEERFRKFLADSVHEVRQVFDVGVGVVYLRARELDLL